MALTSDDSHHGVFINRSIQESGRDGFYPCHLHFIIDCPLGYLWRVVFMVKIEHKKPEIKTDDFARLVFDAVYEERFLSKELIVPKIKTLAKMYRLKLQADNFNAIEKPSKTASLIRSVQEQKFTVQFLIEKLENIIGSDNMQEIFKERDKLLLEAGFK